MDIVERLLSPINEKEDYFISQWPNEEQHTLDAVRFQAAKEIKGKKWIKIESEGFMKDCFAMKKRLTIYEK